MDAKAVTNQEFNDRLQISIDSFFKKYKNVEDGRDPNYQIKMFRRAYVHALHVMVVENEKSYMDHYRANIEQIERNLKLKDHELDFIHGRQTTYNPYQ